VQRNATAAMLDKLCNVGRKRPTQKDPPPNMGL
jgi:hypothetical protein